jgi:hypothetical protein
LFCWTWGEAEVAFSVVGEADADETAILFWAVLVIGISDAVVALEGTAGLDWVLLVATSDAEGCGAAGKGGVTV